MSPRVWLKFEKKKKDGTVLKLKIQDLPSKRIAEITDLMVKYFLKEEPYRKAIGFIKNPKAVEEYKNYIENVFRDPASRNVMCCADNDDHNPVIMGISSIGVVSALASNVNQHSKKETRESKLMDILVEEGDEGLDVLKEFNIPAYYADQSILVLPDFRGHGLSEKFLTVRRLMCAAHGIPLTAAWMSSHGTQVAAQRDGWKDVFELGYADTTRRHGVPFVDVPPSCKLFVAGPHPEYSSIMAQVNLDKNPLE